MRARRSLLVVLLATLASAAVGAQVGRGTTEWLTAHADAQRTSWIRMDPVISVDAMSKPGFQLQWKQKLDNQARQSMGLAQGVTANGVTLFVPMSVVAGSSNNIYALDNDTGYVVWQRHFDAAMPAATAACPGGITAAATRIVTLTPAVAAPGRAGGRGGAGYRSLLGEPGEGVPVEARAGGPGRGAAPAPARGGDPAAPPAGAPAGQPAGAGAPAAAPGAPPAGAPGPAGAQAGGPGRGAQPAGGGIPGAPAAANSGGGLGRPSGVMYAVSSDGMLHVIGLQSGKDLQKPAPFVPANSRWSDPIAVNTTMYAATSGGCGGAPNGIFAIDLAGPDKAVTSWKTSGGGVVGAIAFTGDGTLIAAIGPGQTTGEGRANAIVALDAKTLQVKDWYTQPNAEFVTGPTILRDGDRELVAAATKDGRVLLLNASSLGGANHATPLAASAKLTSATGTISADALATWQEGAAGAGGASWVLVPVSGQPAGASATNGATASGAVVALKLTSSGAAPSLQAAWTSNDLVSPASPIVVNGVVFALSAGRAASPAVLHAYDGASGKALWSSQKAMTSAASPVSFWSALGQIYVGGTDGTVYAFGFLDERR
ncbi:MAG: hypothetical protein ABI634_07595 [Acidobacteriota bacterium]